MTESKKKVIFEKTSEVLSEYELTGISKNELVRILQQDGIASRMTFYEYFDEMADSKRANIIRIVIPKGKINAICYPTPSNQALVKLKEKFKTVIDLLDLIKKYPELGDCFIPLPKLRNIYYDGEKLPPNTGYENFDNLYGELIHSKKSSFGESRSTITLRSHKARHDILKELPVFLTLYLNLSKKKYSRQVKEESIKILTPIFLRALQIFNNDYLESLNVSKKLKETIQETAPQDSVIMIRLIKPPTMPHVEVEFLKILGRYYYSISKKFSKKMEFDSCEEQRIISRFIKSFYGDISENNSSDSLDDQDIEKIFSLNDSYSLIRDKENVVKEYGFDKDSIVIRLVKTFFKDVKNNDDALHIKIYYFELFLTLELFNKKEQQILQYVLEHDKKIFESEEWDDPKEAREMISALYPDQFSEKGYK